MSLSRYPKYRQIGVDWLDEVPEHWEVCAIKRLAETITDGAHISPETENGVYPFVSTTDVVGESIDFEGCLRTSEKSFEYMVSTGCRPLVGDVLFSKDGTIGRTVVVNEGREFAVASSLIIIRPAKNVLDSNFLNRLCQSTLIVNQVERSVKGAGLPRLSIHNLRRVVGSFPPLDEQTWIAAFLERETAKIDSLMEQQRRLIDLLREKRQAIISNAVTRGLNDKVPMRASGIEWLGQVPEHWKVVSIKWLSTVKRGASPRPIDDPKYFDDRGEFAWVRIADVSASNGVLRETTQRLSELGSSLSVKIGPGELFVSIAGTVGKPCLSAIKACIHDGFVYFPTLKFDPKFLYRIFEAGGCYGGLGKWGTQLNLNTDTIGSIRIAVPPDEEMCQVLAFLDSELGKLDRLTAEAERAIELLEERRTALISAAVTGQIDVRGSAVTEAA